MQNRQQLCFAQAPVDAITKEETPEQEMNKNPDAHKRNRSLSNPFFNTADTCQATLTVFLERTCLRKQGLQISSSANAGEPAHPE